MIRLVEVCTDKHRFAEYEYKIMLCGKQIGDASLHVDKYNNSTEIYSLNIYPEYINNNNMKYAVSFLVMIARLCNSSKLYYVGSILNDNTKDVLRALIGYLGTNPETKHEYRHIFDISVAGFEF